jgi:hypothetical protein
MSELEQSIIDNYKKKYDVYINISYLLHQAGMEETDKDISDMVLKRAGGCKLMIDYMSKNKVLG